jgi:hypothetical protein
MIIGHIDAVDDLRIVGWCLDTDDAASLQIELYKNGDLLSTQLARHYRPGLFKSKRHPTGKCGFNVNFKENDFKDGDLITVKEQRSGTIIGGRPFPFFKDRIYFMHIAKASGTSLNDFIAGHYDRSRVLSHMEGKKDWTQNKGLLCDYDFISGHLRILRVLQHHNLKSWFKVTLLREPLEHLISHLAWVKRIGENPSSSFFLGHSTEVKDLARRAHQYDFTDAKQLSLFMDTLTQHDKNLFDNCQTRYFLPPRIRGDLTDANCEAAIKNMGLFDLIGISEHYDEFLQKLCAYKNWEAPLISKRLNVNNNKYGLSSSSKEQLEVLEKYIRYDSILYQKAINRLNCYAS